jgi:hypothetical protein
MAARRMEATIGYDGLHMVPRRLLALPLVAAVAAGCRAVLGVDDLPPLATADAGGAGDAADDAAPAVRYCDTVSPAPQICADFDDGSPYGTGFDNGTQNPDPGAQRGGTLARDTAEFLSGPASLLLQTPAVLQTSDSAAAILLKTLPAVTPRLSISFDMLIDSEDIPPGDGFVILAAVDYGIGGVVFERDSAGPAIAVVPDGGTVHLSTRFPLGVWKTVDLSIENAPFDGGADGRVTGGIDGGLGAATPLPAKYQQVTTKPHLTIGPSAGGPAGAFKAHMDNVRIYYGR